MCGEPVDMLDTAYFIPVPAGVPVQHVKPESRLKCQSWGGKMLLGTFKTMFNSVFLVPTKTNTPYHMAKKQKVLQDKRKKER